MRGNSQYCPLDMMSQYWHRKKAREEGNRCHVAGTLGSGVRRFIGRLRRGMFCVLCVGRKRGLQGG